MWTVDDPNRVPGTLRSNGREINKTKKRVTRGRHSGMGSVSDYLARNLDCAAVLLVKADYWSIRLPPRRFKTSISRPCHLFLTNV